MLNPLDLQQKEVLMTLQSALKGGDKKEIQKAWGDFHQSIADSVKAEMATANADKDALRQRGYRALTSAEQKFYDNIVEAARSTNPRQAVNELVGTDAMPHTIIESVFEDLKAQHPLLSAIKFVDVKYLTTWILAKGEAQKAQWGKINEEIKKELEANFDTIDVNLCKLSAFAVLEKDMLDLGPAFIDKYIRGVLTEAIALGLEDGIINGTGKDMPVGMIKDIHEGVSVNSSTGYPDKKAVAVKSFRPEEYGKLLAKLAVKENEKPRTFTEAILVVNPVDYFTKIMPATTAQSANGGYVSNVLPFPTKVVQSVCMAPGKAVIGVASEYFMGIGAQKGNTIEFCDEYKFIEDQRTFKIKLHGMGRAVDNTAFHLLDISKVEPNFVTVEVKNTVAEAK